MNADADARLSAMGLEFLEEKLCIKFNISTKLTETHKKGRFGPQYCSIVKRNV